MGLLSDVTAIRKSNGEILAELRKLNETEAAALAALEDLVKFLTTADPVVGIEVVPGVPQSQP